MEIKRRKFQGVLNILSFNRHFYVFGLAALAAGIISHSYFGWNETVFWIILIAFLFGLIMPLIVSAYVYDFSGFYDFTWLGKVIDKNEDPPLIVNINAGFDETSFIIKSKFR